MAISHIPKTVGHNFAPEYQISSVPYIIDLSIASNYYKYMKITRYLILFMYIVVFTVNKFNWKSNRVVSPTTIATNISEYTKAVGVL